MSKEFTDFKHIFYDSRELFTFMKESVDILIKIRKNLLTCVDLFTPLNDFRQEGENKKSIGIKTGDLSLVMITKSLGISYRILKYLFDRCEYYLRKTEFDRDGLPDKLKDIEFIDTEDEIFSLLQHFPYNEKEKMYLHQPLKFYMEFIEKELEDPEKLIKFDNEEDFEFKIAPSALVIYKMNGLLQEISTNFSKLAKSKPNEDRSGYFREIVYNNSLLKHIPEVFYFTLKSMTNDLFYEPEDSDNWKALSKHIEYVEIRDEDKIIESYEKFSKWVVLGNAVMSKGVIKGTNKTQQLMRMFLTGVYGSLYFFHLKNRKDQYKYFVSNPDLYI